MKFRQWLKIHFAYNTGKIMDEWALTYLSRCQKIIDVGCGNGKFIQQLPEKISGIDLHPEAVNWCKQQGLDVVAGDALDLPFEDESYDGIHCSHLIEHLFPEEAWELLKQLDRILKPGGIMCLQAPLMSRHFYNDLSHIRPYPPQAIMEYYSGNWQDHQPLTFEVIKGEYEIIKIKWRHLPVLSGMFHNPLVLRILEGLASCGIRSSKRSGYLLVIRKK
ncbi:MAG: class I SAM-dependent methyltransferase [Candidatus Cloacimonetes bacterium]|nr:class I SAM-dependent methyltransferase [Candidatus Cloacimonadota bacterium]